MQCMTCSGNNLEKFLSLGLHPSPDSFLNRDDLEKEEHLFPLDVFLCKDCKLVQLGEAPDPKLLFTSSFIYTTGSSGELVKNFHALAEKVVKRFNLSERDLVIDIGSNDGTLLENFKKKSIKVLGIDPSESAKLASEKQIPTFLEFFNKETAEKVLKEYGKAKVITATNVFAHVRDLDSFMKGLLVLLKDKGVFIEESHYLLNLIKDMEYDSIYAEHLRYYSLKPLIYLFEKYGLQVFDAEKISTHGGSLRVYACRKGYFKVSENVSRILKEEESFGLYSIDLYKKFSKKVEENAKKLKQFLLKLKSEGNSIVGIGAPAKGNTLLNYMKIGPETLNYLAEKKNLKVGKYSPGMHIEVVEESKMFEENPDYGLLLSWNLKNIIVPKIREKGFKGKVIVPVPSIEII